MTFLLAYDTMDSPGLGESIFYVSRETSWIGNGCAPPKGATEEGR